MIPADIVASLRTGLAQLNAGALEAAASTCAALRARAPDEPAVLQLHATIALRAGRADEARTSIERALRLRPGHAPSLLLAARAARAQGDGEAAIAHARAAQAAAPNAPEPAFLLADFLLEAGDPGLEAWLRQLAYAHKDAGGNWQRLAMALQRAGRAGAALDAFTLAAGAAGSAAAAAEFGRGKLLREAGQAAPARAALRRATALDPAHAAAWFALGLACQDEGDETEAEAAYAAALAARPDLAEAAVNLGIARQRQGRMADALDAYRAAVQLRPDTLGRIAQAMAAASTGMLYLDMRELRRRLGLSVTPASPDAGTGRSAPD